MTAVSTLTDTIISNFSIFYQFKALSGSSTGETTPFVKNELERALTNFLIYEQISSHRWPPKRRKIHPL